jgi:predicted Fe-Mo cluster-binding NifX family protein
MNIAITASGDELENSVFSEFSNTPYLLIVNIDTMAITSIPHVPQKGSDRALAKTILEYKCEAIITGKLKEEAFNILADEGVTRYATENISVREALEQMEKQQLQFIRNVDGTSSCTGSHHN